MRHFQSVVPKKSMEQQDNSCMTIAHRTLKVHFQDPAGKTNTCEDRKVWYQEGILNHQILCEPGNTLNPLAAIDLTTETRYKKENRQVDAAVLVYWRDNDQRRTRGGVELLPRRLQSSPEVAKRPGWQAADF